VKNMYFVLGISHQRRFAHAYLDRIIPTTTCRSCGSSHWNLAHPLGTFSVRLGDGRTIGDFIGCEFPWIDLVQHRAVDVLLDNGVTGFETTRVLVAKFDKGPLDEVPPICRLVVHGQGGPLIPESIVTGRSCPECGPLEHIYFKSGLVFDEHHWDGSDVFRVNELPGVTLVTQKVADLIEKYKLTNARLVDTRNYPTYPQKKPQV
jgi:hypothetical protein